MNTLVMLSVAGVLVAVGLVLVLLSILGSRTGAPQRGGGEETTAEAGRIAAELETETAREAEPAAQALPPPVEPPAIPLQQVGPGPYDPKLTYDFRAKLGFRYLSIGAYEPAVWEFQRALAGIDNRRDKLSLYMEIGDAFRSLGMHIPAMAAYMQAADYAETAELNESLRTMMNELADYERLESNRKTVATAPNEEG